MFKICRLCLKTDEEIYNSLETGEYDTQTQAIIPDVNINIVKGPTICSKCTEALVSAYTFKENCLRTEELLRKYLKNGETKICLEEVFNNINAPLDSNSEISDVVKYEELQEDEVSLSQMPIEEVYVEESEVTLIAEKPLIKEEDPNKNESSSPKQKTRPSAMACPMCKKVFFTNGNLQKHLRYHEKYCNLNCRYCGLKTDSRSRLQEHLRCHTGERPYKCKFCDKAFAQSGTRTNHMKTMHSTERPFMCEVCGKTFAVKSAYGAHVKTHQEVEKNCVCKTCGKAFRIPSMLREHEKRHAGLRDQICELCGKGFADNHGLKRHMRLHSGTQPYECTICGKRLNTNFNRKVHMKTCIRKNDSTEPVKKIQCGA